jgi:hypothetical protein
MFIEVQRYKLSLKHKNNQPINFQKRDGFRDPLREGFIQTLPFCIPSIYAGSEAKTGGCEGIRKKNVSNKKTWRLSKKVKYLVVFVSKNLPVSAKSCIFAA